MARSGTGSHCPCERCPWNVQVRLYAHILDPNSKYSFPTFIWFVVLTFDKNDVAYFLKIWLILHTSVWISLLCQYQILLKQRDFLLPAAMYYWCYCMLPKHVRPMVQQVHERSKEWERLLFLAHNNILTCVHNVIIELHKNVSSPLLARLCQYVCRMYCLCFFSHF